MVKIQLIEPQKGWLDAAEGTRFPITISASDIRDTGSRSGSYSKTVILAGTENNNKILNYYFDVNIQAGTFDINKIQRCVVWQDDEVVLDDAVIRLISVSEVLGDIQYEAQVLDSISDFFTSINDQFLTDIDLSDLNHAFTNTNVFNSFDHNSDDGYVYVMPYQNDFEYSIQQFKPAVFGITYLDRIFAKQGKKYIYETLDIQGFSDLIIPYNGDTLKISEKQIRQIEVIAGRSSFTTGAWSTNGANGFRTVDITNYTEVKDLEDLFVPDLGVYTSPVSTAVYSGTINFELSGTLRIKCTNNNGEDVFFKGFDGFIFSTVNFDIGCDMVYEKITDTETIPEHQVFPIDSLNITSVKDNYFSVPAGTTTLKTTQLNVTAGVKDVEELSQLLQRLRIKLTSESPLFIQKADNTTVSVGLEAEIENLQIRVLPTPFELPYGYTMEMNRVIPIGIKQSDFIKSLLKMFNAYMIPVDENTYRIVSRDVYYDEGEVKDWTFKIDLNKERTTTFIPELTSKEVLFTYKADDKDIANDGYSKATNSVYGEQSFIYSNQYARGKDVQELIFSPTPHSLTSFGAYLPMINGFAPKNNIRVLHYNGKKPCAPYNVKGTNEIFSLFTNYPQALHLDDPLTPRFDINFGICDFYFYNLTYFTPNTLFNRYYLRQMNQINKGKLMTAYFNLTPTDIRTLKLNDKIKVGNTVWNINRVIDYDANSKSVTKVELISIDDGQRVQPKINTPSDLNPQNDLSFGQRSSPMTNIPSSFERTNIEYTNILIGSNIDVKGKNNYIVGDNITLIGDNNTVLANNVFGVANNSTVLISNTVIQDATVIPSGALTDEFGRLLTDENGNNLTI